MQEIIVLSRKVVSEYAIGFELDVFVSIWNSALLGVQQPVKQKLSPWLIELCYA